MNEELKIIIKAVTDNAKKGIQDVKKELGGIEKEGKKASGGLGKVFKGIGVAAGVAVTAIGAIIAALVSLGNSTKQYREEQAKLNSAFLAMGSTTEQAAESYKNLYRFLGDSAKATEAAGHLAKLTQDEQALAEWTTTLQGVYATFGDSLPIEGLTEAANETAKVGKVTGTLADALNWAGVSEDAFNASLAQTNSEAEREALIRNTLNGLYKDAAQLYEKNNADIIAYNEAQARLDETTARLGKKLQPLLTSLLNLSNALLTLLAPAIEVIGNALTWLIDKISGVTQWLTKFFGISSGKSEGLSGATANISSGLGNAASNAGNLASGLGAATAQAEKLKRATAGFDELNVMKSDTGSSGGSAGGGSGIGAGDFGGGGGFALDTSGVTGAFDSVGAKLDGFVAKIKGKLEELKVLFAPTISAFQEFGAKIGEAIQTSLPNFNAGLENFKLGFGNLLTYLWEEFIPNFTNSWSENILPIFGDVTAWSIEELGKTFEWLGGVFNDVVNDIIVPALELFNKINNDTLTDIKAAWDKNGGEFLKNISELVQGLRDTIDKFYKQFLKPVIDTVLAWVDEMWTKHLEPLWNEIVDAVLDIANNITILWNKILKPVIDWILQKIYPVVKNVIDNILAVLGTLIGAISGIIQGIIKVIKGIVQFITGVFTGDWQKAWNGVKNIVVGIFNGIWSAIKGVINLLIDGLNGLWTGIYQAVKGVIDTIGDIVGLIGKALGKGNSWSFKMPSNAPRIPKLATGGIVDSATLAVVGERGKEAVLPLENNTEWMDKLADKIASRQTAPSKVVLMLDGKELGYATINSFNTIYKQTGTLPLMII